jgi:hypothetical protein
MVIIFLLFTCFFVNMVGDAHANAVVHEKLSRPLPITQQSIMFWGRHTYTMTKQGLLRVAKFEQHNGMQHYRVYWHNKRSPAKFFCDMCKKAFVGMFDFHFHMNYDHGLCLKSVGKNNVWCRISEAGYKNNYKCEYCKDEFQSQMLLKEHAIKKHKVQPYIYDEAEDGPL